MAKTLRIALVCATTLILSSLAVKASELPGFEKWPGYKLISCTRSDGGAVDFKLENYISGIREQSILAHELVRVTKVSTGTEFIIFFKRVSIPRSHPGYQDEGFEYYFYKDKQLIDKVDFYKSLETAFAGEDYQLITSGGSPLCGVTAERP